jgi:hypothetical protein
MKRRLALASLFSVTLCAAYAFAATHNAVPKYDPAGSLIDSAITEVGGKVGIGTASPAADLEVKGSGANARIRISAPANFNPFLELIPTTGNYETYIMYGTPTGSAPFILHSLKTGAGRGLAQDADGRVGIGTSTPAANLEVTGAGANTRLRIKSPADFNPMLELIPTTGNYETYIMYGTPTGTAPFVLHSLKTGAAKGFAQDASGNVGVGTSTPADKLHVVGNVRVDGNIGAKYQDVAEWVPASEPAGAGTVVAADPIQPNHVRPAKRAYDTAVAGVVSPQPGVLLGEGGAGKVIVAQSGRVRVKVDGAFGQIAPGDLLVSSPVPGYAMRSKPIMFGEDEIHRPGTILGKALERWSGGKGEILVLLTLQ